MPAGRVSEIAVGARALLEAAIRTSARVAAGGAPAPWERAGVLALADRWPAVSAAGFELRLHGDDRMDLGVRLDHAAGAAGWLAGRCDPALARLGARWPELAQAVPFVFAEVDEDRPRAEVDEDRPRAEVEIEVEEDRPGKAVGADPSPDARVTGLFARVLDPHPTAWEAALDWLRPDASKEVRTALRRCLQALPADARPLQLGTLPGRPAAPLRWFGSLPADAAAGFLQALGFGDRLESLAAQRSRLAAADPFVMLQLDLLPGRERHLGLEIDCRSRAEPDPVWRPLLRTLCSDGRCSHDRARSVETWPGRGRTTLRGFGWPCGIVRDVSHVKIAVAPRGAATAKAYLYAEPAFALFD